MKVGVFYFPTDYGINIAELASALEERGFEFAVRARAHPHPGQPQIAVPGRRRAAQALLPHARSVRGALVRRRGDQEAQARHRHLPGPAARADRHRQVDRQPRPALGRPLRLRHRRRLERRRDGESRRPVRRPASSMLREHVLAMKAMWTKEEAELSRQVRELRSGLVVSQAHAAAASADPAGRRERPHPEARRRLSATAGSRARAAASRPSSASSA